MRREAFCPANVAASISAVSRVAVATSALHSKQYFSDLPGSSNNSSLRPHTLHRDDKFDLQQSGSISMVVLPWPFFWGWLALVVMQSQPERKCRNRCVKKS
jgi:hypothetical protein